MKTLIDIPEQQINELKNLCQSQGLSRAEIIRRAISVYIEQHKSQDADAFGLWKHKNPQTDDGLQYQKSLRDEW